jgi:hypothetical protein
MVVAAGTDGGASESQRPVVAKKCRLVAKPGYALASLVRVAKLPKLLRKP